MTIAQNKTDKRNAIHLAQTSDSAVLLAAWPGEWSQDVFLIDDLDAASKVIG